jgi:hypothetical protein
MLTLDLKKMKKKYDYEKEGLARSERRGVWGYMQLKYITCINENRIMKYI